MTLTTTWLVTTREYQTYRGGAFEPPEYGRDFAFVACAKRDAKAMALRVIQQHRSEYGEQTFRDALEGECPFTGMTVEPGTCSHGVGFWLETDCPDCRSEIEDCL